MRSASTSPRSPSWKRTSPRRVPLRRRVLLQHLAPVLVREPTQQSLFAHSVTNVPGGVAPELDSRSRPTRPSRPGGGRSRPAARPGRPRGLVEQLGKLAAAEHEERGRPRSRARSSSQRGPSEWGHLPEGVTGREPGGRFGVGLDRRPRRGGSRKDSSPKSPASQTISPRSTWRWIASDLSSRRSAPVQECSTARAPDPGVGTPGRWLEVAESVVVMLVPSDGVPPVHRVWWTRVVTSVCAATHSVLAC